MSTFVAVAEAGGFAPAARRLALSPPSVTRAVAELEGYLGCRLLQRTMQHSLFEKPHLPQGFRPRRAPDPAPTPPTRINRDTPLPNRPGCGKTLGALPMLYETL